MGATEDDGSLVVMLGGAVFGSRRLERQLQIRLRARSVERGATVDAWRADPKPGHVLPRTEDGRPRSMTRPRGVPSQCGYEAA